MQISRLLAVSLLLFVINNAFSQQSVKEEFLGKRFKDYYELGNLTKISSAAVNIHYGVAHLKKGNGQWLFLSTYTNSEKHADDFDLKVIDIINLPSIDLSKQRLVLKNCQKNGKDDPTILACVVLEDTKYLTKVLQVWKVDKPKGKIISFATEGVRCLNY